jgi:hypothetical protein
MSSGAATTSSVIVEAVRQYLAQHPDAADSPEGILRWWLPKELQRVPIDLLRQALEILVVTGEVHNRTLPDGTSLYIRAKAEGTRSTARDTGNGDSG